MYLSGMLNGPTGLVSKDCSNSGDSNASKALYHENWFGQRSLPGQMLASKKLVRAQEAS